MIRTIRREFTTDQAAAVALELGLDFGQLDFDVQQFRNGMRVELEHGRRDPQTDVTHDDPIVTGKIALAHLREMPDYYERLEAMEKQAR